MPGRTADQENPMPTTDQGRAEDSPPAHHYGDRAIDMARIAELLRTDHGITDAYVEYTGGGCATIYAGAAYEDPEWGCRYTVVAGPGDFYFPSHSRPGSQIGTLDEFYIGPDDMGFSDPWLTFEAGTPVQTEAQIAEQIGGHIRDVRTVVSRIEQVIQAGTLTRAAFLNDPGGQIDYLNLCHGLDQTPAGVDEVARQATVIVSHPCPTGANRPHQPDREVKP